MKGWLAYSGAFALAVGAAVLTYLVGFTELMSSYGYGIGGFILLAVIFPVLVGFVTFAACYYGFTKQRFGVQGWLNGFALLFVAVGVCTALIVAGWVPEVFAAVLLLVMLFFGGRAMIVRSTNA